MIRVCTINDKEILEKYLQEEPYAGAILAAIEEFGFDEKFQTVYLDSEKRNLDTCLLYTSPIPRDPKTSRMPSAA